MKPAICEKCEAIGMTPGPGPDGRSPLAGQRLTSLFSHRTLLEHMLNHSEAQYAVTSYMWGYFVFLNPAEIL